MPAAEIEEEVVDQLRGVFRQPEIIVGTWRAARAEQDAVAEKEAREAPAAPVFPVLSLDPRRSLRP